MNEISDEQLVQNKEFLDKLLAPEHLPTKKVPMKRFDVEFVLQAVDGDIINRIQDRCTYYTGKGSKRSKQVDDQKFGALLIKEACVLPNWDDAKLLTHYKTHDAVDVIRKRLLAGEISFLTDHILDLSGFDDGTGDGHEDVKN